MNDDASWASASLHSLLQLLDGKLSARKARLIACAAVREAFPYLTSGSADALRIAERFADRQATALQLASARFGARFQPSHGGWPVCWAPEEDHQTMLRRSLAWVIGLMTGLNYRGDYRPAELRLERILRELVADPTQTWAIEPSWRTWYGGCVVQLAQAIYETRDYERLPILGDALEEAGCTDERLLTHCRSEQPHLHGCWLLDLLLQHD